MRERAAQISEVFRDGGRYVPANITYELIAEYMRGHVDGASEKQAATTTTTFLLDGFLNKEGVNVWMRDGGRWAGRGEELRGEGVKCIAHLALTPPDCPGGSVCPAMHGEGTSGRTGRGEGVEGV